MLRPNSHDDDQERAEAAMEKPLLRRHFRQRRKEHLPGVAAGIIATTQRELPALLRSGQRLGLFWPLTHEPDLLVLAQGTPWGLALPAVRPEAGLIYLPWDPQQPLTADACGVPAPLGAHALAPQEMALLLVPALAVSPEGLRLGSGGGWYDRLRADSRWRGVPALAVLPAACVAASLPRDPWDIPFNGWLDEHGLHWARGALCP